MKEYIIGLILALIVCAAIVAIPIVILSGI